MSFRIIVDPEKCKSCELCIAACPKHIMRLSEVKNARGFELAQCFDESKCIGCKICAEVCPDVAIEIIKENDDE